jgi:T5SS/PEP-CTERM-associated repeat protein
MPRHLAPKSAFALAALTLSLCLPAVAMLSLAPSAAAADKFWAYGTGQWDVSGNWNPSGWPLAGDGVNLTQSDAINRIVTYNNTANPTAVLNYLIIGAQGAGTMTLDMPNDHTLSVTTEYVGFDWHDKKGVVTQSAGTNNAATLHLGFGEYSDGSYTITGGTLSSSGYQSIGGSGTGRLAIQNGAHVSSTFSYVGRSGSGTVTVDGTASDWTLSAELYVGNFGTGTLNVQNDGQVSNTVGYLGNNTGSSGTATVDGIGSKWVNSSDLYVGNSGTGTLNVRNGGQVSNRSGYLGYNSGTSGTATVDGSRSKWTNSESLHVGNTGTGTLKIQNGGEASDTYGYLGYESGSSGTATVDGSGSKWTNSQGLYVGIYGNGTLNVKNGGQVSCVYGYVGCATSVLSKVTVDGSGSQLNCTGGTLMVGSFGGESRGKGSVTVQNGGQLTVPGTIVLFSACSLNILSGGIVSTNYLSRMSGSTFNWVNGTLNFTRQLSVGDTGSLGTSVTLGAGRILNVTEGTYLLTGSSLTLSGGNFTTDSIVIGYLGGTFNWTSGTLGITGAGGLTVGSTGPLGASLTLGAGKVLNVTNTTTLQAGSALTLSGGSLTTGSLVNSGGILTVNDATLLAGTITNTGTIRGRGDISGAITNNAGGIVAPGASPGILTVDAITFATGSTLQIELGGTARGTEYDVLAASGTVALQSGSALAVTLINSYVPQWRDEFDILDFAGLSGEFGTRSLPALGGNLEWDISGLYTTGTITVVPEPATLALVLVGVAGTLLRRRRR